MNSLSEVLGPKCADFGFGPKIFFIENDLQEQWVALAETQLELVEWLYVLMLVPLWSMLSADTGFLSFCREQFLEVYNDMSLAYRKALLRRSRLGDPKFVRYSQAYPACKR